MNNTVRESNNPFFFPRHFLTSSVLHQNRKCKYVWMGNKPPSALLPSMLWAPWLIILSAALTIIDTHCWTQRVEGLKMLTNVHCICFSHFIHMVGFGCVYCHPSSMPYKLNQQALQPLGPIQFSYSPTAISSMCSSQCDPALLPHLLVVPPTAWIRK